MIAIYSRTWFKLDQHLMGRGGDGEELDVAILKVEADLPLQ
jgi:hypothetical protein